MCQHQKLKHIKSLLDADVDAVSARIARGALETFEWTLWCQLLLLLLLSGWLAGWCYGLTTTIVTAATMSAQFSSVKAVLMTPEVAGGPNVLQSRHAEWATSMATSLFAVEICPQTATIAISSLSIVC